MGFSILGSVPTIGPLVDQGKVESTSQSRLSPAIEGRRAVANREAYRRAAESGVPIKKRLRCKNAPPQQPLVSLAGKQDGNYFRLLTGQAELRPGMEPQEAINALVSAGKSLPDEVALHNHTCNRFIIRVSLVTPAGLSKFEGTPRQMVQTFPPLRRAD